MRSSESDPSSDAGHGKYIAAKAGSRHNYRDEEHDIGIDSVQLARFRAACQQKSATQRVRETEARARALAIGSATEELKRERRKRKKAAERAKQYEAGLQDAQSSIKQLQYTNNKLQQQLASTQAAAKIAADRSSRCLRSLRESLLSVETDTSSKFTQGQQQVQHIISLTKQLQSFLVSSFSSNNSSSSPADTADSGNKRNSNSQATQAISSMFHALAALGELLVPSSAALADAGDRSTSLGPSTASKSSQQQPKAVPLQHVLTATLQDTSTHVDVYSSKDVSCLTAQLAIQQARFEDMQAEKRVLQQRCNSLQLRCEELQQQLRQQASSCAALSHENQVESTQHLAQVAGLQAEKLQLQTEVESLQRSLASSQAALQSLREQHDQQTSRLAHANTEVLQLRSQVTSLKAEFRHQQQDLASALCIVSGREPPQSATAAGLAGRNSSPKHSLLSSLGRPGSAAAAGAAASGVASLYAAAADEIHYGRQEFGSPVSRSCISGQQWQQQEHQQGMGAGSITASPAVPAGWEATQKSAHRQLFGSQQKQQQEEPWGEQELLHASAGVQDRLDLHTTTSFGPLSGTDMHHRADKYHAAAGACAGMLHSGENAAAAGGGLNRAAAGSSATAFAPQGSCAGVGLLGTSESAATGVSQQQMVDRGMQPYREETILAPVQNRPNSCSKLHIGGLQTAVSPSDIDAAGWQSQGGSTRQPLSAAERHRALVADADAALARLAACRKAAGASAGAAHIHRGIRDNVGLMAIPIAKGGASTAARNDWCRSRGGFGTDRAGFDGHLGTDVFPGAAPAAATGYDRYCTGGAGPADALRSRAQGLGAARSTGIDNASSRPVSQQQMYWSHGRAALDAAAAGPAVQQDTFRLQELRQELDALDEDFAHAEAQLQAATARLSGNAT